MLKNKRILMQTVVPRKVTQTDFKEVSYSLNFKTNFIFNYVLNIPITT